MKCDNRENWKMQGMMEKGGGEQKKKKNVTVLNCKFATERQII